MLDGVACLRTLHLKDFELSEIGAGLSASRAVCFVFFVHSVFFVFFSSSGQSMSRNSTVCFFLSEM